MTGFVSQTLAQLFYQIPVQVFSPALLPDTTITGIVLDSRSIQPGNLFVALSGGNVDGHKFIPSAIERGAAAVVGMAPLSDLPVPYVQVEDSRFALAHLSAAFYRFPARDLIVIGVTGTDGKTTTSNLIYQILLAAGIRSGIISTVNAFLGDEVVDTGLHVTTPEAPDVQRYLARMLAAGLTHVVLESTSHGLAQHRVTGCEFDVGVVTNITHEHLDFHGTYEAYREAKARLFTGLADPKPKKHGKQKIAILNRDDQSYKYLNEVTPVKKFTYSLEPEADLYAEEICYDASGLHFMAVGPDFRIPIDSQLAGSYNISNCLAAVGGTVVALGIEPDAARRGIAQLKSIPGRMEQINEGQDFMAIVDFAHTPNALKQTLQTARELTRGRVLVAFGSAGLRDKQKRRLMAGEAVALADVCILTAEDPRTESLDDILVDMAEAASAAGGVEGETFWRVPDRRESIRKLLSMARPGDVVLSCGKGHEQSMCFGEVEYPWDDRVAMRAALAEYMGKPGPQMPFLT